MALRDTLEALRRSDEAPKMSENEILSLISEWRSSVDGLISRIRDLLAPLERDEILCFESINREIQESDLGSYEIQELIISTGSRKVSATPIGRLVAGATGRVDLIREGHLNQMERVMLLRHHQSESDHWRIETRTSTFSPDGKTRIYSQNFHIRRLFEPLTQESLESSIEYLMQL